MNTIKTISQVLFTLLLTPSLVLAETDENVLDYDSIVKQLSSSSNRYQPPQDFGDPLANVQFHGGVAYMTSYIVVDPEFANKMTGILKGVEFTFGIDLLSKYWIAEGSVRSFQREDLNRFTQISLREFDLRVAHLDNISQTMKYRIGAGLSSRYLTFKNRDPSQIIKDRYTTPSSIVFLGAEVDLSDKVSIGPDISYRSALVDDTVDKKSIDANIKLNAHF